MMDTDTGKAAAELLAPEISELLAEHGTAGQGEQARSILESLLNVEVAEVMQLLPHDQQVLAIDLLPRERAAAVIAYLSLHDQQEIIEHIGGQRLADILNDMTPDDRAQLLDQLPGRLADHVMDLLRPQERLATQAIMSYPQESVGRFMTSDYLTLSPRWTVRQAMDHIRRFGHDAETLDMVYVVDSAGKLLDDIRLRTLLLSDPLLTVESVMDNKYISLQANQDREEAVRVMQRYDMAALPVEESDGSLVGIVTFDDVADVAEAETTEDIQKMGGLQALEEPYISMSIWRLFRKRGSWLAILFIGETLTATAQGYFQSEIEKAAVLSMFIALIISSGGNSGSQASTLIIRAMAVRELGLRDWWRVLSRELSCGLMLGLLLGGIGLLRINVWQWAGFYNYGSHYLLVAATVSCSLVGVVLWGSIMGSMLPFALRRIGLDPAAISAPFIATLVDVSGLIIYFTLAMVILHGTLL